MSVRLLWIGQNVSMTDCSELPPDQQRQALTDQMRILRGYDRITRSHSVEALARSSELLAVPVYRLTDIKAISKRCDLHRVDPDSK